MKIAITNFSGNVGKSTVARHFLAPRMNAAKIISVESINSDGSEDEAIRGKQFGELMNALTLLDDVVVDVGASNVESFIDNMRKYHGSHEDFDFFVVPVTAPKKQQIDTISTISTLKKLGVPKNKIKVIFNILETDEEVERVFPAILAFHDDEKCFDLDTDAVIRANDIFEIIKELEITVEDAFKDETNYRALIANESDSIKKMEYSQRLGAHRLAITITNEMNVVFNKLFGA